MSIRTPPPPPPVRRQVSIALLANVLGALLVLAAVAGVLTAAWKKDHLLGLTVTSVLVGVMGWLLCRVRDEG